jgi:hypothetical protein
MLTEFAEPADGFEPTASCLQIRSRPFVDIWFPVNLGWYFAGGATPSKAVCPLNPQNRAAKAAVGHTGVIHLRPRSPRMQPVRHLPWIWITPTLPTLRQVVR